METLTLHFHCGNRVNLSPNLIVLVFSLKAEQMTKKDIFSKQFKSTMFKQWHACSLFINFVINLNDNVHSTAVFYSIREGCSPCKM